MKYLSCAALMVASSVHAYDMPKGGVLNQLQWTGDYSSVCESGTYARPELTGPCNPEPGTYQLVVFDDNWKGETDGAFTLNPTPEPTPVEPSPTFDVSYVDKTCSEFNGERTPSESDGSYSYHSDDCATACPIGSRIVGVTCTVEVYIDTVDVWKTLPHGTRMMANQGICSHRYWGETDEDAMWHGMMEWTIDVQAACLHF